MIHPSELLRTDSVHERPFSAPTNIITRNNPLDDCGLSNCPLLTRLINLEKFASSKIFIIVFSIVGFLQGISITYFRKTAKIWGEFYHISEDNIDWIIYTNEFFVGLVALPVAYWGNRIHRISWIGGLTIYHAMASLLLIIPEAYRKTDTKLTSINSVQLCLDKAPASGEINHVALGVLMTFELIFSMASVSFLTHGITYLDDNTTSHNSPAYIAIALASQELGKQLGIYAASIPILSKSERIFISSTWILLSIITFLAGFFISLFPRSLPSIVMQELAASMVDIASGHEAPIKTETIDGFFKTLFRLLKNKILMLNITCVALLQSALVNLEIFEKYFNQLRFGVSSDSNSITQWIADLLKQPLVALSIIACGMVIAKTKSQIKSLVKWNIIVTVLVIILYASTAFLKCDVEIEQEYKDLHSRPSCSAHCTCSIKEFQPICIQNKTYFSPCMAGCMRSNNSAYYENCSCGGNATPGGCNSDKCYIFFTITQVNRIISTALLGSTLVTNLIINLRCIMGKDKALALGLEAAFIGIIPYLPVKAIYGAISGLFCSNKYKGACTNYLPDFALFLSMSTVILIFISLIISCIMLWLLKSFKMPREDKEEEEEMTNMNNINCNVNNVERTALMQNNVETDDTRNDSEYTSKNSLWEMENVGDDHDSIDFASGEEIRTPVSQRNRNINESDL